MADFALRGSQRWLQIAVNRKKDLLLNALHSSGAIAVTSSITWFSPIEQEFEEYRDNEALKKVNIDPALLKTPLAEFWPARGPVWDGLGVTSEGQSLFVEAKAHISEAASPASKASSDRSKQLIDASLKRARLHFAPRSTSTWGPLFYQYANRLAHHYFLTQLNGARSVLVFLYFVNDRDMHGPLSEEEWKGAVRLIHCLLGLPENLRKYGVFDAFLDVNLLRDALDRN
jgi:hypothetical protein